MDLLFVQAATMSASLMNFRSTTRCSNTYVSRWLSVGRPRLYALPQICGGFFDDAHRPARLLGQGIGCDCICQLGFFVRPEQSEADSELCQAEIGASGFVNAACRIPIAL